MASNTGCTSDGELAITFNISAVAACCARASVRSLLGREVDRRLTLGVDAMRRLVTLRPFARPFATLVLPPLDARAISVPEVQQGHLIGPNHPSGRAERAGIVVANSLGQCQQRVQKLWGRRQRSGTVVVVRKP